MMRFFGVFVLAVALFSPQLGQASEMDLAIKAPWSRATSGRVGVVYMIVENHGSSPEKLVGARSPLAAEASIHRTEMEQNVMRMRPAGTLEIPKGGRVELAPGGLHIMLMGLTGPLEEGGIVPLILTFEHAGDVSIEVPIGPAGGDSAPMQGHGHDKGHDMPASTPSQGGD